jgi:eukaryotic-like serine/threonine-protein kinase
VTEIKGPRYKIDREIGRGAFGVVYLARDNVLRRNVALKVMTIPEGLSEEEKGHLVDRFYREARAAAGLSHPNIVVIHDISRSRDKHFISMEFLQGRPLSELLAGRPLPLAQALASADEVLSALEYAHAHEVIHRDIKPDNIFILDDGGVKLVDFGLARVQASTTITQSGAVMGSPGYIAPEVIDGKQADKRTDVFSFGVVFYEMLTGRRPFGPADAFESFIRVIYRIMQEQPPAPSTTNPEVIEGLDAVVLKALAKEPDDRFQDASEFKKALRLISPGVEKAGALVPSGAAGKGRETTTGTASADVIPAAAAFDVVGATHGPEPSDAVRTEILQFEDGLSGEKTGGSRSKLKVLLAVGGSVIGLAAIAVLLFFLLGSGSSNETTVPNVINLPKAQALAAISKAGLKVGQLKGAFSYEIWKGRITTQKPSAGTKVAGNSVVELTVSLGSEVAQIPDVVGKQKDEAARLLAAFTFKPRLVTGYSPTVPVDCVISQNPPGKTLGAQKDTVTLVINNGVKPQGYVPPARSNVPRSSAVQQNRQ